MILTHLKIINVFLECILHNKLFFNFMSTNGKGKGRLWVLQHCCLEAYCTLTRMSSFIHLQRRCGETSASEGRNYTWNLASNL